MKTDGFIKFEKDQEALSENKALPSDEKQYTHLDMQCAIDETEGFPWWILLLAFAGGLIWGMIIQNMH